MKKRPFRMRRFIVRVALLLLGLLGLSMLIPDLWYRGKPDDYGDVDIEHLLNCVTRSNSCYYEPHTIRYEFGSHVEIIDFPESGMRVVFDGQPASGDRQWVVLRGTMNLPNVYADLNFVERENHELGIRVHRGFDEALQECLPWVIDKIDRDRPVCITGHSLGGSVAVLLAAILDRRGYKDVSVVTFGQPKVTDAHGAKSLSELDVLRVVFDDDPVPLVPPFSVGDGDPDAYCHFGAEVVIKADGHFYYTEAHDPERLDVTNFWSNLTHLRPKSHLLGESYIPSLKLAKEISGQTTKKNM
jgi:triacylglycerol lipase